MNNQQDFGFMETDTSIRAVCGCLDNQPQREPFQLYVLGTVRLAKGWKRFRELVFDIDARLKPLTTKTFGKSARTTFSHQMPK